MIFFRKFGQLLSADMLRNAELILGREKQVAGDLFEVGLHICFVVHDAAFNFRQHVEVQLPGTGFGGLVLLLVAIRGLLYLERSKPSLSFGLLDKTSA